MSKLITLSIPDDPWYEKRMLAIARDMNIRYRERKENERERSSLPPSSPIPLLSIYISKEKEKEKKEIPYSLLSTSNIDLPIPSIDILKQYVIFMEWDGEFDTDAFYNYMEKRSWRDANGEIIKNWAKVVDSSYSKGKFKGRTPKPAEPKELPYSLYGLKEFDI